MVRVLVIDYPGIPARTSDLQQLVSAIRTSGAFRNGGAVQLVADAQPGRKREPHAVLREPLGNVHRWPANSDNECANLR